MGGVNAGLRVVTDVNNANAKNFEWSIIGACYSSALEGENVGVYGQAWGIVENHGPLWGMVAEARDREINSQSTIHGIEIDCFGGQGTSVNRNRIGAMIVAGNARSGQPDAHLSSSECWAGLYLSAVNAGPGYQASYRNAIHIGNDPIIYPDFMEVTHAINIYANGDIGLWDRGAKNFGIALQGTYVEGIRIDPSGPSIQNGIDLINANFSNAAINVDSSSGAYGMRVSGTFNIGFEHDGSSALAAFRANGGGNSILKADNTTSYSNGIDFDGALFPGGFIFKSNKFNIENIGLLDFVDAVNDGLFQTNVQRSFNGVNQTGDFLQVKIGGIDRWIPIYNQAI